MHNSVAKKIFAVGLATSTALMAFAPFAAHAAAHAAGTNIKSSDGTVWMVTSDGMRRPYTSAGAFLSYGFNSFASVVSASAEDLALSAGAFIPPQDGSIICSDRGTDKGTCYLITGSQKAGFTSAAVFTGRGFSFSNSKFGDVSWMNSTTNINETTTAHRPGVLVNNHGTVYLMGPTGLLGIPDLATFNSWGYSFANVVPANAADAAMTQNGVMAMRIAGQLNPTALTGGSNNPPVVSGSVSASLSSDTPASGTVVAGQAIADLAHFTFSGNGTVTQVVLKRIGVSADATLSNVYLYNGNTKLTDSGSVSNGTVTFSNTNGLFSVNGSTTISVKSDIASGTSGQTVGAQLASFTVANGSPVSASLSGNTMTIATATLATVVLGTPTATGAGGNIAAGTMNASLWSNTLTIGQRAVSLKYASFKQIGSIQANAVTNLKLYVNGSQVGSPSSIGANNTVNFDLTGSLVNLTTGAQTIELRGDVVAGSSFTYSFRVQTVSDLVLVDSSYGVNISATGTLPSTPGTTTISSGTISVQSDASFTATQVVKNSSNVTLGQWTLKAYGEDVKVQSLKASVFYKDSAGNATTTSATEGFNNLTLYVNGGAVGSSQSNVGATTNATTTYGTTNLFTIPAGTQVTVAIKGDLILDSTTKVASVRADLNVPSGSFQGATSFNTSPSVDTAYTGTTLTVVSSSATLAANGNFSNQTMSSNVSAKKIGSYTIQANSAEGVRVTSLTVTLSGTIPATTSLANLYIVTPGGQTSPVQPASSNNFATNFSINANQTATVDVYADISNITGTVITALNGSGTGISSGQAVTLASATGQTITVANGTLSTPTLNTSASPVAQFVIAGTANQAIATYNFTASNGGVTIQELDFSIATASGATSVPVTSVTVGGVTAPVVGTTSVVTGLNISVPAGSAGIDVPVTVNYASVGINGGTSNKTAQLTLTFAKYLSGSTTTNLNPSVSSNVMTVVGSKPTVTIASPVTTLGSPGSLTPIANITVAADAAGNIKLNNLPITVTGSGGVGIASGSQAIVYVGGNQYTSVTGTTFASSSGSTVTDVITFTNGYTISAGTSVTFTIYATLSGTLGNAGTSALTTQISPQASFTWTDVNGNVVSIAGTNIANFPQTTASVHN